MKENPRENKMELLARHRLVRFPRRPLIMGIININDDSFCGDGRVDSAWALQQAAALVAMGADIVDAGAESARTNRPPLPAVEEVRRLLPFLEGFERAARTMTPRDAEQVFPPLLSINTWRSEVVEHVLSYGVEIINDMGGRLGGSNAALCARCGAALVLMHSVGDPKTPHTDVRYQDVMADIKRHFAAGIEEALEAGLSKEAIILDPGIDFAKQKNDNLKIYSELAALQVFGRPILLPVSRKTVIRDVLGIHDPLDRDPATAACLVAGVLRGASIVRVHNVEMASRTVCTLGKLQGG